MTQNVWLFAEQWQNFASTYYISQDRVTIRTYVPSYIPVEALGSELSVTEFEAILKTHTTPISVTIPEKTPSWIDGSYFNDDSSGVPFVLSDVITISQDSLELGHTAQTDQAVIMIKVGPSGDLYMPFNRTLQTYLGRLGKNAIYTDRLTGGILSLKTDFANSTWSEASIVVKANPAVGLKVFIEGSGAVIPQPIPDDIDTPHTYPTLVLSAPSTIAEDAYATVSIECQMLDGTLRTDCQSEVFLEAVAGYLPKTRVKLVDGIGSFKVGSLGLTAGDTVRVKAGWRYVPGLGDVSITVE